MLILISWKKPLHQTSGHIVSSSASGPYIKLKVMLCQVVHLKLYVNEGEVTVISLLTSHSLFHCWVSISWASSFLVLCVLPLTSLTYHKTE